MGLVGLEWEGGLASLARGGGLEDWGIAPGLGRPLVNLDARGLGLGFCTVAGSHRGDTCIEWQTAS